MASSSAEGAQWDEINGALVNERGMFAESAAEAEAGTVLAARLVNGEFECLVRFDSGRQSVLQVQEAQQGVQEWGRSRGSQVDGVISKAVKAELFRLLRAISSTSLGYAFSQPVTILYPELEDAYAAAISRPMDFGTIYVKLQHDRYNALEQVREDIQTVFDNCRAFNASNIPMISSSDLVESLVEQLWREWLGQQYFVRGASTTQADLTPRDIQESREASFAFAMDVPISVDDANRLLPILIAVADSKPLDGHSLTFAWNKEPPTIDDALKRAIGVCTSKLRAVAERQSVGTTTLRNLVKQAVEVLLQLGDSAGGARTKVQSDTDLPITLRPWKHMDSFPTHLQQLCSWLDDVLGRDIIMFVKERALRGSDFSSVWARPWKIVWAQPSKSPYWPGMIIAGHNVPPEISITNVHRLPDAIARDLLRSRPAVGGAAKTTTAQTAALSLEEVKSELLALSQFVIVEFFDSHDFGWVRHDLTQYFDGNKNDPNSKTQKKLVPQGAIAEGKQAQARHDELASPAGGDADTQGVSFRDSALRDAFPELASASADAKQQQQPPPERQQQQQQTPQQSASKSTPVSKPSNGAATTSETKPATKKIESGKAFRASDIQVDAGSSKRLRAIQRVRGLIDYLNTSTASSADGDKAKGGPSKRPRDSIGSSIFAASPDVSLDHGTTPNKLARPSDILGLSLRAPSFDRASIEPNNGPIVIPSAVTEETNLTARVNLGAAIFHLEAEDAEKRKHILRAEVKRLKGLVEKLEEKEQQIEKTKERARPAVGSAGERMKFKVGMISQLAKQAAKRTIDQTNADDEDNTRDSLDEPEEIGSADNEQDLKRVRAEEDHTDLSAEAKLEEGNVPVKKPRARKSEFRGVSSQRGKWAAKIEADGQKLTLGVFESQEEAAKAYDNAARLYFGSSARTNFDEEGVRVYPKRLSKSKVPNDAQNTEPIMSAAMAESYQPSPSAGLDSEASAGTDEQPIVAGEGYA